jgi:hypothetical protein
MSRLLRWLAILMMVLGLSRGFAQTQQPITLTLAEVIEMAAARPAATMMEERDRAVDASADAEWFSALLPIVG